MRAVVQRVAQASVTGGGKTAAIERGLCVLVGFEQGDTAKERDAMVQQLLKLKLFTKPAATAETPKAWTATVGDVKADILLISQFTLNATLKSGRPSFHRAMGPDPAREMWDSLIRSCAEAHSHGNVKHCVFGSMMNVHIVNEGPVTICLQCTDGKCSVW